jgi:Trypsin-like peptidase domain
VPRPIQLAMLVSAAVWLAAAGRPAPETSASQGDNRTSTSAPSTASENNNVADAVCPVVYQLDDSPGTRGYHYIFYGNAFFINRDGYLLTAAHVLSEFQNGGQPSVLLRLSSAPPRLVKVTVVATDIDHDVAILRATPNPFAGPYMVASLPLAGEKPSIGDGVEATALRPARARDPHTFELPIADSYPAAVLGYRSMSLAPDSKAGAALAAPSQPQVLTAIFLFSHEVQRGQSGAPVASSATREVVGLVEGRWLHPPAGSLTEFGTKSAPALTQGAAVPIPYALALLRKNHISWSGPP